MRYISGCVLVLVALCVCVLPRAYGGLPHVGRATVLSPNAEASLEGTDVEIRAKLEGRTTPGAVIFLTAVIGFPNEAEERVSLRDDGRFSDESAGDGVFTGLLKDLDQAGDYTVCVKTAKAGGESWSDTVRFSFTPKALPAWVPIFLAILVTALVTAPIAWIVSKRKAIAGGLRKETLLRAEIEHLQAGVVPSAKKVREGQGPQPEEMAIGVPALQMKNIIKTYPGVRALDSVDFEVARGEVHALVGENGAGKSTLMKILAGAQPMDSGEILIDGAPAHITTPQKAMDLGVSIIYQEFNLVPYLNAAENIFLGREPKGAIPGFIDFPTMYAEAQEVVDHLGVNLNVRTSVNRLSIAQQQMVEIAKATSRNATIIAMDEPSATLTEHELESLFALIRSLKEKGVSIIYISHRLEEIFQIADRVTVLRDGHFVDTKPVSEVDRDEIIRMMVGRELKEKIPKQAAEIGPPALTVKNLTRKGAIEDINFTVHKGEVLGISGLVGAGRTELARAIFGADQIDGGEILLNGAPVQVRSPRDAIRQGIGLVTEDRKELGLILGMVVRENISLANLDALTRFGFVNRKEEKQVALKYIEDLMIKTPSCEQQVQNLSGGNQQKVVLAKWLYTESKVLIFDEPTRGIDVGSKVEIYQLMNRLAASGAAIIMISSELPEILGMSDRILVMHEGTIAGELSREDATQEKIMHLATGGE